MGAALLTTRSFFVFNEIERVGLVKTVDMRWRGAREAINKWRLLQLWGTQGRCQPLFDGVDGVDTFPHAEMDTSVRTGKSGVISARG